MRPSIVVCRAFSDVRFNCFLHFNGSERLGCPIICEDVAQEYIFLRALYFHGFLRITVPSNPAKLDARMGIPVVILDFNYIFDFICSFVAQTKEGRLRATWFRATTFELNPCTQGPWGFRPSSILNSACTKCMRTIKKSGSELHVSHWHVVVQTEVQVLSIDRGNCL
jgi:hypothetical protein